jgi:hypothetical protein
VLASSETWHGSLLQVEIQGYHPNYEHADREDGAIESCCWREEDALGCIRMDVGLSTGSQELSNARYLAWRLRGSGRSHEGGTETERTDG